MGLNKQQKKAVEYLEGPLLVLAGPGTGKTQLLSEKVAYILKKTDTNPENILCLTFTDTGAKNMRERLKTIVGRDGLKVNIGTYHAFGQEILAQYKGYAVDYDRRLDAAIDEVTQYKIVRDIQAKLPATDILRGDGVKDIIAVISDAKGANLNSDLLMQVAMQNIQDSEVLSKTISPLLLKVVPRNFAESYTKAYRPIYELLKQYAETSQPISFVARYAWEGEVTDLAEAEASAARGETVVLDKSVAPRIERVIAILARSLKEAIVEAEASESVKPLSAWKDSYFEKDEAGEYRLRDRVANRKLISVARVMREYEQYLQREGLYDFDDMIQEAARILREDAGFKATLQEKYQFVMLDEFQDTNPSQLSIVKELTDYEKPMVMAVGDDDQAIYEFQGAQATNLTDFQEHYRAEVIALTENYRSTQEILDFAHEMIAQAPDRFADKELTAHQPAPEKSQIQRLEFRSSDAECGFVAREIAKLVRRGVPQSQIAVISQKRKYFEPLLPYLKARPEIKIAYEKRDNLLENEQIHEIVTLSRYVQELAAGGRMTVSIMEVLSYPFFRLSMLEVVRLTAEARAAHLPAFDYLAEHGSEELRLVLEFMAELAARSFTEPLEVMLNYIIGTVELPLRRGTAGVDFAVYKSPFLEFFTGVGAEISAYQSSEKSGQNGPKEATSRKAAPRADGLIKNDNAREYRTFQLYENIAALKGRLKKHFGEKRLTLKDLIEMVDDYEAAEMTLAATSPYRDAEEAVQILTAHKAKGLEFEYVFILAADHTAWGKGKGNNNLLALPKNLVQIRHTGVTDSERLRVLYVALTRAKRTLYITNALQDFQGKSPERLEYLGEYVEKNTAGEEEVISPYLPTRRVQQIYEAADAAVREEDLRDWLASYLVESPDMRAIYRERAEGLRMSASALTAFIDVVYAGPMEFFKSYILQVPREAEDETLAYGDLVHRTFEYVTRTGADTANATAYFLEELAHKDLPSEVTKKLREKGPADLAVSLAKFGEILGQGEAEVDFAREHLVVNGVPVTGKIDHLVVNEAEGTVAVYDFKTGAYHKERWQSHATLYKYQLQLLFYKMLLKHSAKYRKYRVERASILFVTPDRDGVVHEKSYEYDEADEAELMRLLEVVYRQVSTLEFLDDPEVRREADARLGLKDIKEFVKLLLAKSEEK